MGGEVKTLLSVHVESSRRADNNSHPVARGGASAVCTPYVLLWGKLRL